MCYLLGYVFVRFLQEENLASSAWCWLCCGSTDVPTTVLLGLCLVQTTLPPFSRGSPNLMFSIRDIPWTFERNLCASTIVACYITEVLFFAFFFKFVGVLLVVFRFLVLVAFYF